MSQEALTPWGSFSSPINEKPTSIESIEFGDFSSPVVPSQEPTTQSSEQAIEPTSLKQTISDVSVTQTHETTSLSSLSSIVQNLSIKSSESSPVRKMSVTIPIIDSKFEILPTIHMLDPNTFLDLPFQDPVTDALNKAFTYQEYLNLNPKKLINEKDVLNSKEPFVTLSKAHSWTSLANLAKHSLLSCHPTQIEEIMSLWTIRLSALYRLKTYDIMENEVRKLGDLSSPLFFYENYQHLLPNNTKKGSMIPFEMRLLICLVPSLNGNHLLSIHKLYELLNECRDHILKHENADVYKIREMHIKIQITNQLLKIPDYELALSMLESVEQFQNSASVDIKSAIGRLHLQLGDLSSAKLWFDKIDKMLLESGTETGEIKEFSLMNAGLYAIAEGKWETALVQFEELKGISSNIIIPCNSSTAYLYQGYANEAVRNVEKVIQQYPLQVSRSPNVIFNVCTLYDLLDQSLGRKKNLLREISEFAGEEFEVANLKL